MYDEVEYSWRGPVTDDEIVELAESYGGQSTAGSWDGIRAPQSRLDDGPRRRHPRVGFVNVAWDGGDHAFLLDTKTRGGWQRRGIGTEVVRRAAQHARAAGCEWLHVDFEPHLASFYFDACGFRRTDAGLIHLRSPG